MGSVAKVVKKATKVIKKPLSKITKGIARGIAKVGKSVMKGVGRLSKKLGPLGMIALSVAMPYALSGLSTAIGHGGMAAGQASGWLGSQNMFLRSIGQVGNAIRTGYQASTGAIGKTWSTITKSIGKGFSKFTKGTGNIWKNISQGAKNLFNSARTTMKKYTPKWRAGQQGTVGVEGWGNPFGYADTATMTSGQAAGLIDAGAIQGSQLSGQTLGSAEGWFTRAGSSEADKLVTQTINNAIQPRVNMLDPTSLRNYNDHLAFQRDAGSLVNNSEALDAVVNNNATKYNGITDFDGSYSTDLMQTGDYKIGTTQPGKATEYTFTGEKTYNNNVGQSSIKKVKKSSTAKNVASALSKSLLTQSPSTFKHPNIMYASAADMTHQTTAGYGGTDIQGSWGGSLLQGAFDDNQRERIMNYYKNMNIIGSQ
jgi:hypothetical protein